MTDIVERLRTAERQGHSPHGLVTEAADLIERLRKTAIETMQEMLRRANEIERLQAALQSLTHDPPRSLAREPDTDCEVVLKMREIARRALEPKP